MSSNVDQHSPQTWQPPQPRQAHTLLVVLIGLNILNFVDRQLLSSFANYIVPELQLSNTEFGLLTGFVFLFMYVIAGLFMGAAADAVSRPRLVAACLALWSGLTAASGAAYNFVTLAIPRTFIGIGESGVTPSSLSMLHDAFPREKRGMASSLYYLGQPLGAGFSLVLAGTLGELLGWRNCFYILGTVGILLAGPVLLIKDPKPPQYRRAERTTNRNLLATLREAFCLLIANRNLRLAAIGVFLANFVQGVQIFDQLWLVQERGFDRAEIARLTGYLYVAAGIAGVLFGAFGGDYALRRWGVSRMNFLLGSLLVLLPAAYLFRLAPPDSWLFWLGFAGIYFQMSMYVGPFFAVVHELTPGHVRATMTAAYLLIMNVGLGTGNILGGALVDLLGSGGVAQPYTMAMLGAHVIANLGLICFALVRPARAQAQLAG